MELYDEIRAFGSKLGTEEAMAGIRDLIARTERSASPHKDRALVPLREAETAIARESWTVARECIGRASLFLKGGRAGLHHRE